MFTYLVWIALAVAVVVVVGAGLRAATASRGLLRAQGRLERALRPELERLEARLAELERTSAAVNESTARAAAAGAELGGSMQTLATAASAAREGLAPLLAARGELAP